MRKNFRNYFLFAFLLFFPLLNYSQTKIKERVGINPGMQNSLSKLNKASSVEYLWIQVSGQFKWSAVLVGPCSIRDSSAGDAGTIKYISIANASVGLYRLKITQYFPNAQPGYIGPGGEVQYAAGYTGFSKDSSSFSYSSAFQWADGETSRTSEFTFALNYINDFEIEVLGSYSITCAYTNSAIRIKRLEQVPDCDKYTPLNTGTDMMINFTIQSQTEDLVFRDTRNDSLLGRSVEISVNQVANIGIALKPSFKGMPETATVTAEINGVTRTANVIVNTYPPYDPAIYTSENNIILVHGGSSRNTIVMEYDNCSETEPPESIKFNLEIEQGNQFGHLKDPITGVTANSLTNLSNRGGKREFEFIADGQVPVGDGTVVIKITGTDSRIEPWYVRYFIKPSKIEVTFKPSSISPGDTANVILKKKNDDETLVDFPADQLFDVQITTGANYGTILLPQWGDTTDET